MWVFMRKADNKRSGEVKYSYEVEEDFVPSAHEYMVLVDCKENHCCVNLWKYTKTHYSRRKRTRIRNITKRY